jgi:hypothetical protein
MSNQRLQFLGNPNYVAFWICLIYLLIIVSKTLSTTSFLSRFFHVPFLSLILLTGSRAIFLVLILFFIFYYAIPGFCKVINSFKSSRLSLTVLSFFILLLVLTSVLNQNRFFEYDVAEPASRLSIILQYFNSFINYDFSQFLFGGCILFDFNGITMYPHNSFVLLYSQFGAFGTLAVLQYFIYKYYQLRLISSGYQLLWALIMFFSIFIDLWQGVSFAFLVALFNNQLSQVVANE